MDSLDTSRIHRIVLLIDLHPLLVFENKNPYVCNVLAAARRILSFPAISSSLAAFKFFFSSLSPILSTSKLRQLLGKSPAFLSFDRPLQTLDLLFSTLNSLFSIQDPLDYDRPACSRASLVAGSLLQLEYDYAWEPQIQHHRGMPHSLMIRSNLVVLFSPIPQSSSCISEYLSEGAFLSSDRFLNKFSKIFGMVKERLISRDIHISWIDASFSRLGEERFGLGLFECGLKELGWGCNRTDAIVLGSALVPFGLIFPYICCTIALKSLNSYMKNRAELILSIKDSSGATLQCKSCDLEFVVLKFLEERSDLLWLSSEKCGRVNTRICVRELWEINEETKAIENSCALILLHGISRATGKEATANAKDEFIADKILKLICDETGELDVREPIWQLILTFLYNRNCSALVSVFDGDGNSFNGMLQPFTLNYALLSIFPRNFDLSFSTKNRANISRRKGRETQTNMLYDISWSSFTDRVFSQSDDLASINVLEEFYFNLQLEKSKKLRFLKCWMKQITKLNVSSNSERNGVYDSLNVGVEPVSSAGDNCLSQSTSQAASSFVCIEDSNAFLESISLKIENALCSKEVDLFILAERLVRMSIDALYTKYEKAQVEDLNSRKELDLFDTKIATEMSNFLLVKPKELEHKCKCSTSASSTIETTPVIYSNEKKIRMHELQILFRMEILLSKVASNFDKCVKQKLIKDCCLLLRNVEFYLHADFFHGESLLDYATRIIKSRYEHSLQDVIHEIYTRMEFFSFDGNEVEASDSEPASNDYELKKGDNFSINNPNSIYMNEDTTPSHQFLDITIERQLMEANKRRNRARRFSSFTSWVPDLQKVWALRHPKQEKHAHEALLPKVKAKKRKRRSSFQDRVCETP
ncbi:uncharacterized protein LOC110019706 isoform X1 [Phalaenopsis equestris]|uniref:uncharacterized protein LOC110019706 isoform X1 n=1 Tax=Phalaenopsis equestris TaxID=78828 RepID=UPI0009E4C4FA|nr:uncharacterized protein LOC110019706 isoform X1 [Phalaenopsis equestris]